MRRERESTAWLWWIAGAVCLLFGLLLQVDLPSGSKVVIGHSTNGESAPIQMLFDSEDGRNVIVNGRPYRETYGSITGQLELDEGVTSTRIAVSELLPDGSRRGPFTDSGKADEGGEFTIKGLPHGEYALIAKVQRGTSRADFFQGHFTIDRWEQALAPLEPGPCTMTLVGPSLDGSGLEPIDGRSYWCEVTLHWVDFGTRVKLWVPFDREVQLSGLRPAGYRLTGQIFYRQSKGRMHASREGRMSAVSDLRLEPGGLRVPLSARR